MTSEISQRFIDCFEILLDKGICRSARHFATTIGMAPQALNEILKFRRDVNIEILEKAIQVYSLNAHFIFKGDGPKFLKEDHQKDLSILTIIEDLNGNERIVHVPVQAQAGYPGKSIDPIFIQQLPSYHLPIPRLNSGSTMRSYEVTGDSMEPILFNGDIVISSYMHAITWEKNLREDLMYVIITDSDVFVKRITNRIREEKILLLHSDNTSYPSFSLKIDQVKEIWLVKAKISSMLDRAKSPENSEIENEMLEIKQMLREQGSLLANLADRLDS